MRLTTPRSSDRAPRPAISDLYAGWLATPRLSGLSRSDLVLWHEAGAPGGGQWVRLLGYCGLSRRTDTGSLTRQYSGEHDRDHAPGDRRVCRIGRVVGEVAAEVIDLEEDRLAFGLKRSKVMFFMRVVGVTKVVEHRDRFDDAFDGFWSECRKSWCHHGQAASQFPSQVVVERANALRVRVHGLSHC